ncbi:MAG: TIM barrel protein [Verrucomicrobiales bacterium]|nr:TIM barrel protein [Verrucomicrobiales bacterium]
MKNRRDFLGTTALATAGFLTGANPAIAAEKSPAFTLNYAPHFGMFKNSAPGGLLDELQFAHDHGFRAWEDNGMSARAVEDQKAIADLMEKLEMRMGVISAKTGIRELNFASKDEAARKVVLDQISVAVETAKRLNAGFMTLVSGQVDPRWPREIQFANCIELLRRAVEIVEPHNITLVMEPLNRFQNHPGSFLQTVTEGYLICEGVDHPNCKVLYDLYHQQIAGGNLIPLFDLCRDQIGYLQVGDNPGRKEPGTGEINYGKVFEHLEAEGFDGIIGMEHGNAGKGIEGEKAVIEAYRKVDPAKPEA